MKKIKFIFITILFISCKQSFNTSSEQINVPDQLNTKKDSTYILINKLISADSVWLISHTGTEYPKKRQIAISNKLNKSIIEGTKKISGKKLDSLIAILSLPTNPDSIMSVRCFDPHDAIIIFKDNKISYLNLCFGCSNYEVSDDLVNLVSGYEMDNAKWGKLYLFFEESGLYEHVSKSIPVMPPNPVF